MSDVVIAAVDSGPATSAVLTAARRLAECMQATVVAVHVVPDAETRASETLALLATRFDVPVQLVVGPVEEALAQRVEAPDVAAVVVGARGAPDGRRPLGHIALDLVQRSCLPVLVAPPHVDSAGVEPWRRVLVPLEGTDVSTTGAVGALAALTGGGLDAVVLHVFTPDTAPRVLDRPGRDLALWDDEFLARFGPPGASIEHRTGVAAHEIARACEQADVDLVVLTWSQRMSPGRAAVIREVLGRSRIPVLLLPVPERRRRT